MYKLAIRKQITTYGIEQMCALPAINQTCTTQTGGHGMV